ncbi:MAG: hypothetical protein GVY05_08915 [Bacteroidetes bacterium]|jgi:hypothetical protein|nr:hypothetical protein [Bacteroidota bacterium]
MAKIIAIDIEVEDHIILKKNTTTNVNVTLDLAFHPLDIKHEMEYAVLISLFDVKGKLDVHTLLPNWDETKILEIEKKGLSDIFLAQKRFNIKATKEKEIINQVVSVNLDYKKYVSAVSLKIDAIAYIIPAINTACKWSNAKQIEVLH